MSRAGCFSIPSHAVGLHFARKRKPITRRPRVCIECGVEIGILGDTLTIALGAVCATCCEKEAHA